MKLIVSLNPWGVFVSSAELGSDATFTGSIMLLLRFRWRRTELRLPHPMPNELKR